MRLCFILRIIQECYEDYLKMYTNIPLRVNCCWRYWWVPCYFFSEKVAGVKLMKVSKDICSCWRNFHFDVFSTISHFTLKAHSSQQISHSLRRFSAIEEQEFINIQYNLDAKFSQLSNFLNYWKKQDCLLDSNLLVNLLHTDHFMPIF